MPDFTGRSVANIAGAIVFVALVTTIVSSPNSSQIITAVGASFTSSLRAAMGG